MPYFILQNFADLIQIIDAAGIFSALMFESVK